jgi:hypothetical protein
MLALRQAHRASPVHPGDRTRQMNMGNAVPALRGLLRGEWRRGSTWRIGLCHYDQAANTLAPMGGAPAISPESLYPYRTGIAADPHLTRIGELWYLFYEVVPPQGHGEIFVSISDDLRDWRHLGPALQAEHHISYPSIVIVEGAPRLLVESSSIGEVRWYAPLDFPCRWEPGGTLLSGLPFADPTVFWHADRWWLFVEVSGGSHDQLHLYHTDDPVWSRWSPHPQNPVCTSPGWARPAGPPMRLSDGRLVRFGQDNARTSASETVYGKRVATVLITDLTPTTYAERFVDWVTFGSRPPSWATERCHHVCISHVDGRLVAAVDGRGYPRLIDVAAHELRRRSARRGTS